MDTMNDFIQSTSDEYGLYSIIFQFQSIDAVYANALLNFVVTALGTLVVTGFVYAKYAETMKTVLISDDDNFHSLSMPILSAPIFIARLLKAKPFLGVWTLLFFGIVHAWVLLAPLGLTFESAVAEGSTTIECLEWSNEGPESLGASPTNNYTSMIHSYISNEIDGSTSVGSVRDKELLRRSIAQGSFGLFKLPTLVGGLAIEDKGYGYSPRDNFFRKEGLLTLYKGIGVSKDYNPNRRENGGVEYGAHTMYEPTNMIFGGEEEVAVIHGIGSFNVMAKKKNNTCMNEILALVKDAEGTNGLKYDSYKDSKDCTGTLVVRFEDVNECISHMYLWKYRITLKNLIGAVRFFSDETDEDGRCVPPFRLIENQRLIIIETNSTEDHIKFDPYIRALARDAYQTTKSKWVTTPENLSDRDTLRIIRILGDIMSDAYRFRLDCPEAEFKVYLGVRKYWFLIVGTALAISLCSYGIAIYNDYQLQGTYKFSELSQYRFWYEAGLNAASIKEDEKIIPEFYDEKNGVETSTEKIKDVIDEWYHLLTCQSRVNLNKGKFEFRIKEKTITVKPSSYTSSRAEEKKVKELEEEK